jgi:hypothetical protein
MKNLRVYILYRFAEENSVYSSWLKELPWPYTIVDDFLPHWPVPADAGLLLTHSHYTWEDIAGLRGIYQSNRVPILILCDGILEYRNTWEHPQLPDGTLFQPALGHKVACLGRAPARILESWGNLGKCEVVGLPRLDPFLASEPPPPRQGGVFRLLVTTAKTPAFTDQQMAVTLASLRDLKNRLDDQQQISGRPLEVSWRLTGNLEKELGLPAVDHRQLPPMMEAIDNADAVITTPSTIYLESVLRKRPTAFLDYHNCPQYVPSAWRISAPAQFDQTLDELAHPPQAKMLYQATMLSDQLECQTPAQPRLFHLIETLMALRYASSESGKPLQIPARILSLDNWGLTSVPREFDLASLFPDNDAFRSRELQLLQIELSAAIKQSETLPLELVERQKHIARINHFLEQAKLRNREMHLRLNKAEDEVKALKLRQKDTRRNHDSGLP